MSEEQIDEYMSIARSILYKLGKEKKRIVEERELILACKRGYRARVLHNTKVVNVGVSVYV